MSSDHPFLVPPPPPPPTPHAKTDEELTLADWEWIGWAVTDKARREAIAFGHPVTIGRDGWMIDVYPDGREERVCPLNATPAHPASTDIDDAH